MADSPAKRIREAKKRRRKEIKAERKRLRKEGLLETAEDALYMPGDPRPPQGPEDVVRTFKKYKT